MLREQAHVMKVDNLHLTLPTRGRAEIINL